MISKSCQSFHACLFTPPVKPWSLSEVVYSSSTMNYSWMTIPRDYSGTFRMYLKSNQIKGNRHVVIAVAVDLFTHLWLFSQNIPNSLFFLFFPTQSQDSLFSFIEKVKAVPILDPLLSTFSCFITLVNRSQIDLSYCHFGFTFKETSSWNSLCSYTVCLTTGYCFGPAILSI